MAARVNLESGYDTLEIGDEERPLHRSPDLPGRADEQPPGENGEGIMRSGSAGQVPRGRTRARPTGLGAGGPGLSLSGSGRAVAQPAAEGAPDTGSLHDVQK